MVNCRVLCRNEFVFSIAEQDNVGQHRGLEDSFISTVKRIQITETYPTRTKRMKILAIRNLITSSSAAVTY